MTTSHPLTVLILLVVLAAVVVTVLARGRHLRRETQQAAAAAQSDWQQRSRQMHYDDTVRLRLIAAEQEAWDRALADWRRDELRRSAQRVADLHNAVRHLDESTGDQR